MTTATSIKVPTSPLQPNDELILVVKQQRLFPQGAWYGLRQIDMDACIAGIQKNQEFIWRSAAETDPNYKQIIPYLIFTHKDRYFLMERSSKASEQRLKSKLTLGIGGHVREEDISSKNIFDWARREFHEEVHYTGSFEIKALGLLNDDTNDVGKVHAGLVLLLTGDSDSISVKSELKSGRMVSAFELGKEYERLESWSKLVADSLFNQM